MVEAICGDCGGPLTGEGASRICPRCVLRVGLDSTVGEGSPATAASTEPREQIIDRYRLVRKLGEGGMGEVWLAWQPEPVRRQVAVKIIKRGMNSEVFVARFERERRALALMSHPAVARIYDAGTTPDGLPYFVMEYVAGEPIHVHCKRHALTLEDRLELFLRVCEGVQHAHQKAIVHRDLKPTNVLVTREGGRSYPKIIDFGVAKVLGADPDGPTMFTELGVLVGTPEYMSPEQALAGDAAIDTRTDVYSLGAILYEMLTGALPFDSQRLRQAGYDGIRRILREEEPVRPSVRLGTLGGDGRTLKGDLDWITMKALSKEPERRYASCAELAADIARHRNAEPVLAGPPSASYRAGKFVKRHRRAVGASTAFLVLLVAALAVTTSLWRVARTQRRLAEERYDRVIQLSDLKRVSDATAQADELWPAHPDKIEALQDWLENEGEPLARALAGHRRALAELRATALPYDEEQHRIDIETHPDRALLEGYHAYIAEKRDLIARLREDEDGEEEEERDEIIRHYERRIGEARVEIARLEPLVASRRTWAFPDDATQWRHDMLEELVEQLETFVHEDPFVGALSSVRTRLESARTIETISVSGPAAAAAWSDARRAIAASARYGGLDLPPQIGLVPLTENPRTGLWEFWHVGTGERPALGQDGENRWRIAEPTGAVLVLVPGGTFWMGAQADDPAARNYDPQALLRESGVHEVSLSPFFLSKYEMTQEQWYRMTGTRRSRHGIGTQFRDKIVGGTHPVEMVTWDDADLWLRRHALTLPTEAQWEFAARAGGADPWWTGPDGSSLRGAENLSDRSMRRSGAPPSILHESTFDDGYVMHAPVGTFRANPYGLFDVLGNVSELCREYYLSPYRGTERPGDGYQDIPVGTASRIYRGGNWRSLARESRVSTRFLLPHGNEDSTVGLRAARLIEGLPSAGGP